MHVVVAGKVPAKYRDSGSDLRYHWHDESSKYDHLSSQRLGLAHYESVVIKVGLREWEIHIYMAREWLEGFSLSNKMS